MASTGKLNGYIATGKGVRARTLREAEKGLRIGQDAVRKAQEENRRLGIPNWYSIDGEIVSDIELAARKNRKDKS